VLDNVNGRVLTQRRIKPITNNASERPIMVPFIQDDKLFDIDELRRLA
jgi:hypothetical protein